MYTSTSHNLAEEGRNVDHLDYDENLYDYMKSLIPFKLTTTKKELNEHVLHGGLEKGHYLNIYYNDNVGKREFSYELILSAILPKEWSVDEDRAPDPSNATQAPSSNAADAASSANPDAKIDYESSKVIEEGEELQCVIIDIMGQFCSRKFMEKVRHAYKRHELHTVLGPNATEK